MGGASLIAVAAIPDGTLGECALMWGGFPGAVRDQAMAAWGYDIDLAVFLAEGVGWAAAWAPLTRHL
eukprot:3712353-Pyramimonas_sp.AAC.1